jgi:hypothetical protein
MEENKGEEKKEVSLVDAAVQHAIGLLGNRLGDEKYLQSWAENVWSYNQSQCHFCCEDSKEMRIDWLDNKDSTMAPLTLACVPCWDLRRAIPYFLVKTHARSLKSGEKKFCGGEFHESDTERILQAQLFEDRFSICKQCYTQNLRKRRIPWADYVKSWEDPNSWQNRTS